MSVRLVIDVPAVGEATAGHAVVAHGWAHAPGGVQTLRASIGDETLPTPHAGVARPDVAEALGDPGASRCGWTLVIPASACRPGPNTLRVTAEAAGMQRTEERTFDWRLPDDDPAAWTDRSGERYEPRASTADAIAIEHRGRYRLAAALAPGRRVLDAGCGLGYGTAMLFRAGAQSVDGLDRHPEAIGRARADAPGTATFTVGDVLQLPYPDASFDLVVCFEVLEHLEDHERLLRELRRVLARDGLLLISSPNRGVAPPGNPWHLRELTTDELRGALVAHFAHVVILRQELQLASVIAPLHATGSGDAVGRADTLRLSGGAPGSELYAVALAGDGPLPELPALIALGDPDAPVAGLGAGEWAARALAAEAEADRLREALLTARVGGAPPPPPGHVVRTEQDEVPPSEDTRRRLQEELSRSPAWMYDWSLPGLGGSGAGAHRMRIHQTRLELLAPFVRPVIDAAGSGARVLDLACNEGWFAHRMLEWGAAEVVGVDLRAVNVRRARLVRDHLGIAAERLRFLQADVHALPDDLGSFDVVLALGLVYHLENPVGAVRVARALTRGVCVVESQLTNQDGPIWAGNGTAGQPFARAESFAAWHEDDDENPVASVGGALSLIPNAAALLAMGRVAGFREVELVAAEPGHEPQYVAGERAVMIARP